MSVNEGWNTGIQKGLRSSGLAMTTAPLRKLSMCMITADLDAGNIFNCGEERHSTNLGRYRLASKSAIGSTNCPTHCDIMSVM